MNTSVEKTGILIDPYTRSISTVDLPKKFDLKNVYKILGHKIDIVERSTWTLKGCDIWLDENGLFNQHPLFAIRGLRGWESFVGPALITGSDGRNLPKAILEDPQRAISKLEVMF